MKSKPIYQALILSIFATFAFAGCKIADDSLVVTSKDGLNKITLSLNEHGELFYQVTRRDNVIISDAPLGLNCDDQDFTSQLSVAEISPVEERREKYKLQVGNYKEIDHVFESRSVTFENKQGALMVLDLIAGEEGVAFRYRFPDTDQKPRTVEAERTEFHIGANATGWLQPYNKA